MKAVDNIPDIAMKCVCGQRFTIQASEDRRGKERYCVSCGLSLPVDYPITKVGKKASAMATEAILNAYNRAVKSPAIGDKHSVSEIQRLLGCNDKTIRAILIEAGYRDPSNQGKRRNGPVKNVQEIVDLIDQGMIKAIVPSGIKGYDIACTYQLVNFEIVSANGA